MNVVIPLRRRAREDVKAAATQRVSVLPRSGGPILELSDVSALGMGVGRAEALSIPACAACRDLVVGTTVQLAVYRYRGGERLDPGYLLTRPDPSTTWVATLAGTVDELAFYGRAYWRVLDRDSDGYPARARWTPARDVTPHTRDQGGAYSELIDYQITGVGKVDVADVIRFDSPLPGVLTTGSRAFAAALERARDAGVLSATSLPAGVLKNEGTELNEQEADELLARFQAAREKYGIAFLQGITYSSEALNAADKGLVEGLAHDATEIARLWNVPVAMIGASPSGGASALLYSNLSQQLAILVSSAVAPHLRTVEQTLSDVLPRGQSVAFDVQTFLRSDPAAAADYAIALWTAELVTRDEARAILGIPAYPGDAPPDLAPGRV